MNLPNDPLAAESLRLQRALAHEIGPDARSEHEWLVDLRRQAAQSEPSPFPTMLAMRDGLLGLFRAHFLLFHSLYRLRDEWRSSGKADLEIHTLSIRRLPPSRGRTGLGAVDGLRAFYLDWQHFHTATEENVAELLAGMQDAMNRHEQRAEALAVLALEDPVDQKTITQQYRRLSMRKHPDRGGSTAALQELNWAMRTLGLRRSR